MITTINNNERIFQIVSSVGHQVFCNLDQINSVVTAMELRVGYFTIYHFWDNKPKKVTKKYLKELFKANGLIQEFYY